MDVYEATRIVLSRIQNLDAENASKIMGLLLIQDHGEQEMIRLAFGPETLVHSIVIKARKELGLLPSNSPTTPTTPSSQSPFMSSSNPITISRQNSTTTTTSSRLLSGQGGNYTPIPSPSSANTTNLSSWATLSELQARDDLINTQNGDGFSSTLYGSGNSDTIIDEFQLQDQLSFLNDGSSDVICSSPTDFLAGTWGGSSVHRRSCSVNDVCLGSEDPCGGIGWKPCLYYARGYCKNGTTCRFLHGSGSGSGGGIGDAVLGGGDGGVMVGSPSKVEMMGQCHEVLRSSTNKAAQQQRLAVAASQLMGSSSFPYSPKSMNLLLHHPQNDAQRAAAAAALMMGEDMYKFGRSRLERNEFVNPASRQIYLTFPADSTFREEDVSNYFSIYGLVQDVRIPYQQKRMFGFVTFVYPETVKTILAKGNPHFVCDARVLVKPYKEKGKVPDKFRKQPQTMDRGEFSPCGTPTGLDSRVNPFDLGARTFYNSQDMLWRRKLEEQADLQQALELQSQRLMSLQLLDIKKHHHHRALSTGSPIPSPTQSSGFFHQNFVLPSFCSTPSVADDNFSSCAAATQLGADCQPLHQAVSAPIGKESIGSEKIADDKGLSGAEDSNLPESLEHNLPDNPFASPKKASSEYSSALSNGILDADKDAGPAANSINGAVSSSLISSTSSVEMASFKSFNCQMPRFTSGHGAIGIYTGAGGPTCPVGI